MIGRIRPIVGERHHEAEPPQPRTEVHARIFLIIDDERAESSGLASLEIGTAPAGNGHEAKRRGCELRARGSGKRLEG